MKSWINLEIMFAKVVKIIIKGMKISKRLNFRTKEKNFETFEEFFETKNKDLTQCLIYLDVKRFRVY